MYKYKSEILRASVKMFSDKANEKDIAELDELLNKRAAEGWEISRFSWYPYASPGNWKMI